MGGFTRQLYKLKVYATTAAVCRDDEADPSAEEEADTPKDRVIKVFIVLYVLASPSGPFCKIESSPE